MIEVVNPFDSTGFTGKKKADQTGRRNFFGSGVWNRTTDLQVMSLISYHCSTPHRCVYNIVAFWYIANFFLFFLLFSWNNVVFCCFYLLFSAFYAIIPPPNRVSPRYITADCPGVIALCFCFITILYLPLPIANICPGAGGVR